MDIQCEDTTIDYYEKPVVIKSLIRKASILKIFQLLNHDNETSGSIFEYCIEIRATCLTSQSPLPKPRYQDQPSKDCTYL